MSDDKPQRVTLVPRYRYANISSFMPLNSSTGLAHCYASTLTL
ncbi:MAG: hypothetical protein V7L29_14620 [Nostoc sp.]